MNYKNKYTKYILKLSNIDGGGNLTEYYQHDINTDTNTPLVTFRHRPPTFNKQIPFNETATNEQILQHIKSNDIKNISGIFGLPVKEGSKRYPFDTLPNGESSVNMFKKLADRFDLCFNPGQTYPELGISAFIFDFNDPASYVYKDDLKERFSEIYIDCRTIYFLSNETSDMFFNFLYDILAINGNLIYSMDVSHAIIAENKIIDDLKELWELGYYFNFDAENFDIIKSNPIVYNNIIFKFENKKYTLSSNSAVNLLKNYHINMLINKGFVFGEIYENPNPVQGISNFNKTHELKKWHFAVPNELCPNNEFILFTKKQSQMQHQFQQHIAHHDPIRRQR